MGNSAYGKFIEAVERQTKVLYTKDKDVFDRHLRSAYFEDLEEIGDAYKIESRKKEYHDKQTFSGRHRGISAGQVANVAVLLRLLGSTISTGEPTSLSRWTRRVCTSPFRTTLLKKQLT